MPPAAAWRTSTTAPGGSGARSGRGQAAEASQASNPALSPKYRGLLDVAAALTMTPTVGVPVSATAPTALPLADTLGQPFTGPNTGDFNDWLVNVSQAGTYTLSVATGLNDDYAAKIQEGQVQVSLADGTSLGIYNVGQDGTYSLGNVPLSAGLNTLVIKTIHWVTTPAPGATNIATSFSLTALTLTPSVQSSIAQSQPTAPTLTPFVHSSAIENWTIAGDATFSTVGAWSGQGPAMVTPANSGTSAATWTFNVIPGTYQVWANGPAASNASTAATYTVLDGATTLGTASVNQEATPSGLNDGTTNWQALGGTYTILGNTLTIRLSGAAGGPVAAGSIRVAESVAIPSAQIVNDNSDNQLALSRAVVPRGRPAVDPGHQRRHRTLGQPDRHGHLDHPGDPGELQGLGHLVKAGRRSRPTPRTRSMTGRSSCTPARSTSRSSRPATSTAR